MAVDGDAPFAEIGDAADDADQRGLAGAVRPQQRKDLAAANLQVDVIERLETGAIGFRQICNGYDRGHGGPDDPNLKMRERTKPHVGQPRGEARVAKSET